MLKSFALSKDANIEKDTQNSLLIITNLAMALEKEETKTRYGIVKRERIMPPEEEYDLQQTEFYLKKLIDILTDCERSPLHLCRGIKTPIIILLS